MKRILIVSPQLIFPPIDGGKKCIYHHIKMLENENEVSLVMGNAEKAISLLEKYCDVKKAFFFKRNNNRIRKSNAFFKIYEILKWLVSGLPRQAQTIFSKVNREVVMNYIVENKIDVVVLESPYASEYLDLERVKRLKIKIILIEHNVEYLFSKDYLKKFGILAKIEIKRIFQYEKKIVSDSNMVISISDFDAAFIKNKFQIEHIKYLPLYLPTNSISWNINYNKYIIFTGSLEFYPNYHGIKWFLENVFIEYLKENPSIVLKITGEISREKKKEFAMYNNVQFTGLLPKEELERLELNCLFSIVPVLKGSGIKIKLLEALSYGIPTIATVHTFQGIPYDENSNIPYLIGKNEIEFLKSMLLLTGDEKKRKALSKNAKNFFNEVYASKSNVERWKNEILNF